MNISWISQMYCFLMTKRILLSLRLCFQLQFHYHMQDCHWKNSFWSYFKGNNVVLIPLASIKSHHFSWSQVIKRKTYLNKIHSFLYVDEILWIACLFFWYWNEFWFNWNLIKSIFHYTNHVHVDVNSKKKIPTLTIQYRLIISINL